MIMVDLTLAGFYGVTRINMGTWLAAPFTERQHREGGDGEGRPSRERRQHGQEPFDPMKAFDAVFGTVSVLLIVNGLEYIIEKSVTAKRERT